MNWFTLLLFLLAPASTATTTTKPADAVAQIAAEFGPRLERSRYMARGEGEVVTVAGWDGFPTRRYTYSVKDKDGPAKSADVILLNPPSEMIARWIVSALIEVKGSYDAADGRKVFAHILSQSGGQFPVAGVVYEDIIPADGVHEIYCFRDGVTVEVEGVPHRGTAPMTPEQLAASIDGKVRRVFTYARIASTSPKMWIDAGGSKDVLKDGKPSEKWMSEIRRAYQAAWNSDRNALVVAWVKTNMK
jgi:hypothetical protein